MTTHFQRNRFTTLTKTIRLTLKMTSALFVERQSLAPVVIRTTLTRTTTLDELSLILRTASNILTKREGRTGKISFPGLHSTDRAQHGARPMQNRTKADILSRVSSKLIQKGICYTTLWQTKRLWNLHPIDCSTSFSLHSCRDCGIWSKLFFTLKVNN